MHEACALYDHRLPMEARVRGPDGHTGLRGRAKECALLDELVSVIRRGESRSLVLAVPTKKSMRRRNPPCRTATARSTLMP